MNEWMNERMNKWMNEWMNEWTKKFLSPHRSDESMRSVLRSNDQNLGNDDEDEQLHMIITNGAWFELWRQRKLTTSNYSYLNEQYGCCDWPSLMIKQPYNNNDIDNVFAQYLWTILCRILIQYAYVKSLTSRGNKWKKKWNTEKYK